MSLVGPRPSLPYEFKMYDIWHRRRVLEVRPGVTGYGKLAVGVAHPLTTWFAWTFDTLNRGHCGSISRFSQQRRAPYSAVKALTSGTPGTRSSAFGCVSSPVRFFTGIPENWQRCLVGLGSTSSSRSATTSFGLPPRLVYVFCDLL